MAILKNTDINDTGYLSLPIGTEGQRGSIATGTIVRFTSVGTTSWTVPAGVDSVEVLVVGGGGGGGSDMGGGGGGGGVVYDPVYPTTPGQSITVTVGSGGAGAPAGQGQARGSNGGNSVFGTITAYGGGGGASRHDGSGAPAGDGASGGGASGGRGNQDFPAAGSGYGGGNRGRAIYGEQGHDGAWSTVTRWYPGGGGGAGGPGQGGNYYGGNDQGGHGGPGALVNIDGNNYYWGGGGGGSGYNARGGDGGIGGGGGGAVGSTRGGVGYNNGNNGGGGGTDTWAQTPGGNGGANTGGGGGGGSHYNSNNYGGNGGSGQVIVKHNQGSPVNEIYNGSLRINSDEGAPEYYGQDGLWHSMAIPFKERTIITFAYMAGGYKNSSAWNNVNRVQASTDTTIDLGDGSLERSFNYQWGACSKNVGFIFGAGNGHAVTSNYIIAFNMRTEVQYNGGFSRNLNGGRLRDGGVFMEHYKAWMTGGSSLDRMDLLTETLTTSIAAGLPGGTTTDMWGMSWEHEGIFFWSNDKRLFNMPTETYINYNSGNPSNHPQQKSVQSKLNYNWAGNEGSYNGGYNLRRTNMITRTTSGTYGKPRGNCGEENFTMGQDHQYMLGEYNGAQNNNSWRWNYYTESGFGGGYQMEPKGKGGSSSGICFWRDN